MGPVYTDHIEVFIPSEPYTPNFEFSTSNQSVKFEHHIMGDLALFSQKPLKTLDHSLILEPPVSGLKTVYIKVQTLAAMNFYAELVPLENYIERDIQKNLLQGVYFGALGIIIVIAAIFALWLKDITLLAYALYILGLFIRNLGKEGIPAVFLPDNSEFITLMLDKVTGFGVITSLGLLVFVWKQVLNTKYKFPKLNLFYNGLILFSLACLFTLSTPLYTYTTPILVQAVIINMVIFLILLLIKIKNEDNKLEYTLYFTAFATTLLGGVIVELTNLGVLPVNAFTLYSYQIAVLIHVIFIALGLGLRIKRLEAAQARAERSKYRQKEFLGFLSHEMRTPLAVINNSAQMIEMTGGTLTDKNASRLHRIQEASNLLSTQIENFLNSEALEKGQLTLSKNREPVISLCIDAIERLPISEEEKSRIGLPAQDSNRTVYADKELMITALFNLLKNAIFYSDNQAPINISTHESSSMLTLTITNSASNLSSKEFKKVGKEMFRGENATNTKGSGIGLMLVRNIAKAHSGGFKIYYKAPQVIAEISLPKTQD